MSAVYPRKGGTNPAVSQIQTRPPAPAAMAYNQTAINRISHTLDKNAYPLPDLIALLDEITRLRAELAAHQWQPISTAPRDETDVLLYGADFGSLIGYCYDGETWETVFSTILPTHWMPLPVPPADREKP